MRALVVDDSRVARMMLKRALVGAGFEVFEAENGRDALEKLGETGPVELALVDWNMPIMTGHELIVKVRERRDMDAMSIMMVTTETEFDKVKTALDAGANEYLMKPFSPAALEEKLLLLGFDGEEF